MKTIDYEWDCETIDTDTGDIIDHSHGATLRDVLSWARANPPESDTHHAIVLVRDEYTERSWAYLNDDGTLPDFFEDSSGCRVAKVPVRFHKEANSHV